MSITLYVGDTDDSVAKAATRHDPHAFLIDSTNCQDFLTKDLTHDMVAYTSLGDLPKDFNVVFRVCRRANKIVYCPPSTWSDHKQFNLLDPGSCLQGVTEHILLMLADEVEIENIKSLYLDKNPVPVTDIRKSQQPQLWFVGPSIVEGTGVDTDQRFGNLIAETMHMPASFLTEDGASNIWCAGQILRSDIRAGDIVIWGLSITERSPLIMRGKLWHLQEKFYTDHEFLHDVWPRHLLSSETNFYNNVHAIEQVTNFCRKCGARLFLFGALSVPNPNFLRYLRSHTNYYHYPYKLTLSEDKITPIYLDLASDNTHPGKQQHRHFADFILEKINDSV